MILNVKYINDKRWNFFVAFEGIIQSTAISAIRVWLLMGFYLFLIFFQLLIFFSNRFLKQQIGTFKLTKQKLFVIS